MGILYVASPTRTGELDDPKPLRQVAVVATLFPTAQLGTKMTKSQPMIGLIKLHFEKSRGGRLLHRWRLRRKRTAPWNAGDSENLDCEAAQNGGPVPASDEAERKEYAKVR